MDLLTLIKQRRSIRRYLPDPVPPEHVEKMIEAAIWAPSSHNADPCEFIVTTEPRNIGRLAELSHAQFIGGAPLLITLLVRTDTGSKSPIMDGSAAAMNLSLAAHALGLGCCWISPAPWAKKLRAELLIPADWKVIGVFSIGYPDESRSGQRKPCSTAIHREKYQDGDRVVRIAGDASKSGE